MIPEYGSLQSDPSAVSDNGCSLMTVPDNPLVEIPYVPFQNGIESCCSIFPASLQKDLAGQ